MFEELQEAVADFIRMIPPLKSARVQVITRKKSDVDSIIENNVARGAGICITVLYPFPEKLYREARGLNAKKISLQIQVTENAFINKTGVSCLQAAEYIDTSLHLWVPGTDGLGNNAIVGEEDAPWKDPPTKAGRNEIVLMFQTAGVRAPIDVILPSNPDAGNYRVQNSLLFQLIDLHDAEADYTTIWAAENDGLIVPLLAKDDDLADFVGVPFAPKVGSNYRVKNNELLQLYNPTSGKWHTLFVETDSDAPAVVLDPAQDASTQAAVGSAPLLGSNYRLKDGAVLQLIGRDGLFYTVFCREIDDVKYLLVEDVGEAA